MVLSRWQNGGIFSSGQKAHRHKPGGHLTMKNLASNQRFWRSGTSENFPCNSILAEEPPTKMVKSSGSAAQSCLFTSKYEKARRSSLSDTRLLSPGRKFTLAKPFSSFTGRGILAWESPT